MPDDRYYFDEAGIRRIVSTVRRVEQMPYGGSPTQPPRSSSGTPVRWLRCENNSGEEIPPYSVVGIENGTVLDGLCHVSLDKPRGQKLCGLTGREPIEVGARGACHLEVGLASYDDDDGTPSAGETWGRKNGQWALAKNYPGFTVLGVHDSDQHLMLVAPAQSKEIPFYLQSGGPVPPYGVMVQSTLGTIDIDGVTHLRMTTPGGPASGDRLYFINGPTEVVAGSSGLGLCSMAGDQPVRAAYETAYGHPSGSGATQRTFGCVPGSFKLHPGLPGLLYVGGTNSTEGTCLVVRSNRQNYWGKVESIGSSETAYGNTSYQKYRGVTVWPSNGPSGPVYDGSGGGTTYPDISFNVVIRHNANQDVAVWVGDYVLYSEEFQTTSSIFAASPGACLDAKAGTVVMWADSSAATIPRGWAIMDGTANSAGNGGSGRDMRGYFPVGYKSGDADFGTFGGTGGAKTHTHGAGAQIGSGANLSSSASNLPPYKALYFIERLTPGN